MILCGAYQCCYVELAVKLFQPFRVQLMTFLFFVAISDCLTPAIPRLSSHVREDEREDFYKDLFDILSKRMSKGDSKYFLDLDLCAVRGYKQPGKL